VFKIYFTFIYVLILLSQGMIRLLISSFHLKLINQHFLSSISSNSPINLFLKRKIELTKRVEKVEKGTIIDW